ncbi:hypothetical protein [Kineococcus terrestris]|uniref:hypothetical protein n=1 Tax=Kineococcus terrestris TaxID=2044856 RepID=UPI0034DACFAB
MVQDCVLLAAFVVFTAMVISDERGWLTVLGALCVVGQGLLLFRRVRRLKAARAGS